MSIHTFVAMKLIATHVLTNRAVTLNVDASRCAILPSDAPATRGLYVSPGWIDIQVNGFAGFDLNAAANPAALLGLPADTDANTFTVFEWDEGAQRATIRATVVNGVVV